MTRKPLIKCILLEADLCMHCIFAILFDLNNERIVLKCFSFTFSPSPVVCREASREQYKYIDGLPNSHKLTITGLRMNTLYLFSVMAYNDLGESKYLPDLQKAQTKGKSINYHLYCDTFYHWQKQQKERKKKLKNTKSKCN